MNDPEFLRKTCDNGLPFGSLPGYQTNLGVVAVPTIPMGGYVYCPVAKKWFLFVDPQPQSSPDFSQIQITEISYNPRITMASYVALLPLATSKTPRIAITSFMTILSQLIHKLQL